LIGDDGETDSNDGKPAFAMREISFAVGPCAGGKMEEIDGSSERDVGPGLQGPVLFIFVAGQDLGMHERRAPRRRRKKGGELSVQDSRNWALSLTARTQSKEGVQRKEAIGRGNLGVQKSFREVHFNIANLGKGRTVQICEKPVVVAIVRWRCCRRGQEQTV